MNKICTVCGLEYPNHKMSCKSSVKEYRTPTVAEFLKSKGPINSGKSWAFVTEDAIIEFAKLHCQIQAETIVKNAKVNLGKDWVRIEETIHPHSLIAPITITVDKDSILNAYPLENIK